MTDTTAPATPPPVGTASTDTSFFGHPRGLAICFFTEMWERFSYYGMRGLLIFYLTKHFLFTDQVAAGVYAAYTSMVYITPVIGGIVADRYLGASKAVVLGAVLLVAGHMGMAIEGAQSVEVIVQGERIVQRDPFYLQVFYLSLALIITGVGFLKANISTMVGSLYERYDPRRDGAFTLFYMGINVGSVLAGIFCGWLYQQYGFSYGFGAAGIGMLLGLVVFLRGQRHFGAAVRPTHPELLRAQILPGLSREWLIYLLAGVGVLACWFLMQHRAVIQGMLYTALVAMAAVVVVYAFAKCETHDRNRMLVCFLLMLYQIPFWALFEQAGSSLNLMTDRNVDRVILGFEIPTQWFQSANGFFIIVLAPVFNMLWIMLARRGWEPSTPMKFALALIQVGLGFLVLAYGATQASSPTEMALIWILLLYLLHSTGELCLSPVGLSMTTKLSVPQVVGMMMGCWFLASALGNNLAGTIAAMAGAETLGGEVVDMGAALANYIEVYTMVGWYAIAMGVAAMFIAPLLKHFMHGIR
ncbi:MAG: peptide MFS transporter [Pseudohongiellaceae bacterium]